MYQVTYAGEHVIAALKAARKEKGFSQRRLSEKAGVPQSHISKIERGAVDLQLSSLIELARVLDLEIMTVPRKLVPAVQAIVQGDESASSRQGETTWRAVNELKRIQDVAKRLQSFQDTEQWHQIQKVAAELANFRLGAKELDQIRKLSETIRKLQEGPNALKDIQRAVQRLQDMRNSIAHRPAEPATLPAVRPAYTLDEDSDA
jgi:transcriptional regulator with XRE-family HTH domain